MNPPEASETAEQATQRNGSKRPAPRGTAAYPRKRAIKACQVCRARRTKCDNLKPSCSFCLKVGAECIQSAVDLSSFDPASLRILDRLDDLERLLLLTPDGGKRASLTDLGDSLHSVSTVCALPMSILPPHTDHILKWPQLNSVAVHTAETSPQDRRSIHIETPGTSPGIMDIDLESQAPSRLLECFLDNVHVKNPILDEVQLHRLVSRVSLHGYDSSGQACLTLIVCALGAISTSFDSGPSVEPGSARYTTAIYYFDAAQKRIGTLASKGGLLAAQCLFLSGVFQATIFKKSSAWRLFSQALACCQEFVSPSSGIDLGPESMSPDEQAVYWSSWKSEREMLHIVKAPDFTPPDHLMYPSFYPTPPAPPNANELPFEGRFAERQTLGWLFYLSEISLRRLSTRITKDLLNLEAKCEGNLIPLVLECVPEWEEQIEQWTSGLHHAVSLSGDPTKDDICKWVLRGQLLNLYELIYWPFLCCLISGQRAKLSPDNEEKAVDLSNKAVEIHGQRLCVNRPGLLHRHHGTRFMIENCAKSALVLLSIASMQSAASIDAGGILLPDSWSGDTASIRDMIRYWQSECPDIRQWGDVIEAGLEKWG